MRFLVAWCMAALVAGLFLVVSEIRADGARKVGPVNVVAVERPTERLSASDRSVTGQAPLSRDERMARIIHHVFGPMGPVMVRIARCESHLNPRAVGDNGQSIGLFQVHMPAHPWAGPAWRLTQPWHNARVARRILREQGLDAWWTCSRKVGAR